VFLPGVDLADAYAPRPVVTKRASNGTALSSASSPRPHAGFVD
jgi:protein-L-isoaspartate(D-aspartate) O-methyltransferase